MRHLSLVAVAACAALVFGTTVHAQTPLPEYGPTVTLEQAMKVANAALAEAKELNVIEAITIVDNAERLVYFVKMDDVRQIGVDLSQGKARTSAFTKLPSKAYEDRVSSGGGGLAVLSFGITASAGGLPI
jgi:glc operon protein GlcG